MTRHRFRGFGFSLNAYRLVSGRTRVAKQFVFGFGLTHLTYLFLVFLMCFYAIVKNGWVSLELTREHAQLN